MGTPAFAAPTLEKLVEAGHECVGVWTQPDRPKGRGQQVVFSPVKQSALRLGLTVHQPERIRLAEQVELIRSLQPDIGVVVGYGQIIPQSIIDIPRSGIVNVHASLLPKYRGAAPIQWSVANGETVTGVTTMLINAGLDTGNMLLKAETPIGAAETSEEVGARLAILGAELAVDTVKGLGAGTVCPEPQNDAEATWAPVLKREDGVIDWSLSAYVINNRVRGFRPWPGAYTTFRGQRLHIWHATPHDRRFGVPGGIQVDARRLMVACGSDTALEIHELQLEGRKRVTADAFMNGQRLVTSEMLGEKTN
jgi:methionyl-tRNA formyltransferase